MVTHQQVVNDWSQTARSVTGIGSTLSGVSSKAKQVTAISQRGHHERSRCVVSSGVAGSRTPARPTRRGGRTTEVQRAKNACPRGCRERVVTARQQQDHGPTTAHSTIDPRPGFDPARRRSRLRIGPHCFLPGARTGRRNAEMMGLAALPPLIENRVTFSPLRRAGASTVATVAAGR
jgi:hypothetical protein